MNEADIANLENVEIPENLGQETHLITEEIRGESGDQEIRQYELSVEDSEQVNNDEPEQYEASSNNEPHSILTLIAGGIAGGLYVAASFIPIGLISSGSILATLIGIILLVIWAYISYDIFFGGET